MQPKVERMAKGPVHAELRGYGIPETALSPSARGNVIDPSFLCCRKVQDNERMPLFLVGKRHEVRDCDVGAPLIFHRVRGNALRGVTVRPPEDALAAFVLAHPEDTIIGLDRRGRRGNSLLNLRTLDDIVGKREIPGIVVWLYGIRTEGPQ